MNAVDRAVESVRLVVGDTPNMSPEQGRRIGRLIQQYDCRDVLELGFRQGVSTCYMARVMAERGTGHLVTIDRETARKWSPNIEDFLTASGCRDKVTIHYEPTSYTWRLMKLLEEDPRERFDLCYLDGAHTWEVDALAFFLVDRLLRPGGWIVFDDLDWTIGNSPTLRDRPATQALPADERETPQVRQIFELLVKPHSRYGEFRVEADWGFARKLTSCSSERQNGGRKATKEHGFASEWLRRIFRSDYRSTETESVRVR